MGFLCRIFSGGNCMIILFVLVHFAHKTIVELFLFKRVEMG